MIFQNILEKINRKPKILFLVDGYGALLSSLLYIAVLANFEEVFGMPRVEVYVLSFLAGLYAIYSFSCYHLKLKNWPLFMKVIAIANLLHCCLTIGLVIYYFDIITILGLIYFAGEVIIVVALAKLEYKTAASQDLTDEVA